MNLSSLLFLLADTGVLFPYYHLISNEPVPHVRHLYRYKTPKEFERDLDALLRDFQPVSLTDLLDAQQGRGRIPRRAFHLSFDDGFAEMATVVAPILRRRGVPATFFVCSGLAGNRSLSLDAKVSLLGEAFASAGQEQRAEVFRMLHRLGPFENGDYDATAEQFAHGLLSLPAEAESLIDELQPVLGVVFSAYAHDTRPYLDFESLEDLVAQGFSLGAHSVDHPRYDRLVLGDQLSQTYESLLFLARLGLRYGAFAFPYSDEGVKRQFFLETKASGLLDISFGSKGLKRGSYSWHFERLCFDAPSFSASRILRSAALPAIAKRLLRLRIR